MRLLALMCLALLASSCARYDVIRSHPVPDDAAQLVARAEAAIEAAGTSPAREVANWLRMARQKELRILANQERYLHTEVPPWGFNRLRRLIETVEHNLDWPLPPDVQVPRLRTPPVIDGKLDDACWENAILFEGSYPFNERQPGGQPITWRLGWDQDHLYVAFQCTDTDLQAESRPRDGAVWEDDCVEIFLLPAFRFRTYWELIVSPSGSVYDSVQAKHLDEWGSNQDTRQDMDNLQVGLTVDGTLNDSSDEDRGYIVELAIPFDQLPGDSRASPRAGQRLSFMMARLDRQGQDKIKPYAYQPLMGWGHNIWNHAVMELLP